MASSARRLLSAHDPDSTTASLGIGWVLLGFIGSALVTVASPALLADAVRWPFDPSFSSGHGLNYLVLYVGIACSILAWTGIGLRLWRARSIPPSSVALVALVWALPLLVAPTVFSEDLYSYLAQGAILHHGLDPYKVAPLVLPRIGEGHLFQAVSPFWRATTAPYGPGFIGLMSVLEPLARTNLMAAVVAARVVELIGLACVGAALPVIAKALGTDPAKATWLALASPLTLYELVAAGHNDALMIGLMSLGVAASLRRKPLLGLALCAFGASVKVPALLAALFIAICWIRDQRATQARVITAAKSLGIVVVVLAGVSAATGVGTGWLSYSVLATPGKVHLAITPVSDLTWGVHGLMLDFGSTITFHQVSNVIGAIALVLAAIYVLIQLSRARSDDIVGPIGRSLAVIALLGPAAWPWYFAWALVLLACTPRVQRSLLVACGAALSVLLVFPNGNLVLPLNASAVMLPLYVACAALALWVRHTRRSTSPPSESLSQPLATT